MSRGLSCENECGGLRIPDHPRGLCGQCDRAERDAYLLDTIEQAIELLSLDDEDLKWPGLMANLKAQKSLLLGETKFIPGETIQSLRRLSKVRFWRMP